MDIIIIIIMCYITGSDPGVFYLLVKYRFDFEQALEFREVCQEPEKTKSV